MPGVRGRPRYYDRMREPGYWLNDKEEEMGKTKRGFGGKKAAPFKKGGGRSSNSPRTAKGTPRKR